jgi:hypothetical protein
MHKRITAGVVTLAGASAILLGSAGSASAAIYDEMYGCTQTTPWSGGFIGDCNGTWWNANPYSRTANVYFKGVTYANDTGYRHTPVFHVETLDGTKKVFTWYCVNDSNTTSGSLGTTTVGGSLPNSYTWASWDPCAGYQGMAVNIDGWYNGSSRVRTTLRVNTATYPHAQWGYECTVPSQTQYPYNCQ